MRNLTKLASIFFILFFLSSCNGNFNFKRFRLKNNETNESDKSLINKDKLEVKISCGEGSIKEYIKKGWIIKKEFSEEKICSWKSIPANENCDIEKDKGCKVITPDKLGIETTYFLEKK